MLIGYVSRAVAARARSSVGGTPHNIRGRKFALADADAARERSGVVVDPVVGDLQVMRPAVGEYPAAALRAVDYGQPINAGGVAHEVAGEPVGSTGAIGAERVGIAQQESRRIRTHSRKQGRTRRKRPALGAVGPGDLSVEIYSLRQDRNSRSLIGAHQRGLLQLFGQVAIQGGVPTHGCLEWQAVNLRSIGLGIEVIPTRVRATEGAAWIIRMPPGPRRVRHT